MNTKAAVLLGALMLVGAVSARGQCDMMVTGNHKHGSLEASTPDDHRTHTQKTESKANAVINDEGIQEATIVIKDGYHPNTLIVKKGIPLRLNFGLQEKSCTGTVVFRDFDIKSALNYDDVTAVEFTPDKSGSFTFSCPMNMVQGTLIVKE